MRVNMAWRTGLALLRFGLFLAILGIESTDYILTPRLSRKTGVRGDLRQEEKRGGGDWHALFP